MTKGSFPGSGTYRDVPDAMLAARKFRQHSEDRFQYGMSLLSGRKPGDSYSESLHSGAVLAASESLHSGKPLWMSAEITRLVFESSLAMPPLGKVLDFWRLPKRGFLLLGSPLEEESGLSGAIDSEVHEAEPMTVAVTAFSWAVASARSEAALFIIAWATDQAVEDAYDEDQQGALEGALVAVPVPLIPMSYTWYHEREDDGEPTVANWPRFLGALSEWMSQTIVTTPKSLDRAGARRAERADLPTEVGVTTFRRLKHHPPQTSSDREYSHRWVVSEHWRNQPCGPGNRDRRPMLIPPHVKGPLDKPLVVKNTVWANIR